MKSRVSFFNGGLFGRDIRRTALLWGAYLLLWFVAMPANLFSSADWRSSLDMRRTVLEFGAETCHVVSALYGVAVAWFLFSYLHKARSANFFGALPLPRETQFLSHYISGLLCSLLPNLVLYGATVIAGFMLGANLVMETAIWLATHSMTFLFYYSFAVLCSMLVGNFIAMPVLYGVLNFLAVVVEGIGRVLVESLLYGVSMGSRMKFGWLSPLYYFLDGNGPSVKHIYENDNLVGFLFRGWGPLLILAAVGLALAACAFLLHKNRAMEVAGDVVAVKCLRPVFLYVFTFGCAAVIGTLLANMLVRDMDSSNFLPISACLLLGGVLGHFLGHMILQRSLRVFSRKNFVTCGISLAALVVVLGVMKLDVCGVVRYVPEYDEVAAVCLEQGAHDVDDSQRIAETLALHQEILDRKSETEALCRRSDYKPLLEITYTLKNGRKIHREYCLPVTESNYKDPNSLICKYDVINNTPEMILSRELPRTEITEQTIDNCMIYYSTGEMDGRTERIEPNSKEAMKLWQNAILPDLQAGNLGRNYYAENFHFTRDVPVATKAYYSEVSVEFQLRGEDDYYDYCHFTIPDTAVHTKAALMEMGVPEEAFKVAYK